MYLLPFFQLRDLGVIFSPFYSSFALVPCDLMIIFSVFSVMIEFFLSFLCESVIDFWFVITMRLIYSNLYISMIILRCSYLKLEWIVTTLNFYSTPQLLFYHKYFTYFCFVYPLTTNCEYKGFYYACLLTFLIALYMGDLTTLYLSSYFSLFVFCL